jgi:serine/threonine protein kinase
VSMAGQRFGAYDVQALLGAGGMGEVYRARDTRLGRDVAIKILPAAFTSDPDRRARFEREARVLASLNHPNIGAIHGVEDGPAEAGPHVHASSSSQERRWPSAFHGRADLHVQADLSPSPRLRRTRKVRLYDTWAEGSQRTVVLTVVEAGLQARLCSQGPYPFTATSIERTTSSPSSAWSRARITPAERSTSRCHAASFA